MKILLLPVLMSVLLAGYSFRPYSEHIDSAGMPFLSKVASVNVVSKVDTFTRLHAYELFGIADSIIENEGYKNALEQIRKYEKFYGDPMERDMFYQVMMTYASMIGNAKEALKYESLHIPNKSKETFLFPEKMEARPAREVIMERCVQRQVVMLNEAHHRGEHRAFMRSMLKDFHKAGFRYFLVEAYSAYDDPELNERKYPLAQTGAYIKEPAFGQLIREAIAIGFDVAAYDTDTADCDSNVPNFCRNERERVAAENIAYLLKRDPGAKILVAAGYDHIIKKSTDGWIKMAEQLKEMSGVDPLSIDLVGMSERVDSEYESKEYKAALLQYNIEQPSILMDKTTGKPFLRNYSSEQIDLQVILPRTKYSNGYSDWLSDGYQKRYAIDLSKISCKIGDLIQVYVKKEWDEHGRQAVPFLQFPIEQIGKQTILLPEKYVYEMRIDHGDSQETVGE